MSDAEVRRGSPTTTVAAALLAAFLLAAQGGGSARAGRGPNEPDGCGWATGFTLSGLDSTVRAFTLYDDGSGRVLYAAGLFTFASGAPVGHVARWDGTSWSPLVGPGGVGLDGPVYALVVYDDGGGPALYAGGEFDHAGGLPAANVARWDGAGWSPLQGPSGAGTDGPVYALAVFDDGSGPTLYVGGSFGTAGGIPSDELARWDGSAWSALTSPLGGGAYDSVAALLVHDDGGGSALVAGGSFTHAGGLTVNNVARWNGSSWSALAGPSGVGTSSAVTSLATYDNGDGPALYAAGWFHSAGGVQVNSVARWDGDSWSALAGPAGFGTSYYVRALAVWDAGFGARLYVGGRFEEAGGIPVHNIASWDGGEWLPLVGPAGSGARGIVYTLATLGQGAGSALIAGGNLTEAGGVPVSSTAKWDGGGWSALESGPAGLGVTGTVGALAVYDDGSGAALFVAGPVAAGGVLTNLVARWNGASWSPLVGPFGNGVDGWAGALAVYDDGDGSALYVGGSFTSAGGLTSNGVARWNGADWWPLVGPAGTGTDGYLNALAVYDDGNGPALYAGGSFESAGGQAAYNVARWDGTAWTAVDWGTSEEVYALAVYDDGSGPGLYAGGWLDSAGHLPVVHFVARWDVSGWSALTGPGGEGVDSCVCALAPYDDGSGPDLYVGGSFTTAGGVTVNGIARWDGSTWSALQGPAGIGTDGTVVALAVHDDGGGPALYVGGEFDTAGGLSAHNLARWDGHEWSAPGGATAEGTDAMVYTLASHDDGGGPSLYVGGSFTTAGGLPSSRIARWDCPEVLIFADGFESGDTAAWSTATP